MFCLKNLNQRSSFSKQHVFLLTLIKNQSLSRIFSVGALPPSTLCPPPPPPPQLQSTCHYMLNHYVKVWHLPLGRALYNMHPLSWGGGKRKKSVKSFWEHLFCLSSISLVVFIGILRRYFSWSFKAKSYF